MLQWVAVLAFFGSVIGLGVFMWFAVKYYESNHTNTH